MFKGSNWICANAKLEFTIDEMNGRIFAQRRLNREVRSAWQFLVLATDENGAGLTGFADVLVEVQDINDNAPVFLCATDNCFLGHVPENSPADTSIMEMRATDLDDPKAGKNAILTYRIVQNVRNEINLNLFSINPATGTIYTVLRSLDREVVDRYLVVVEARDGGGLSGTGTATIIVSDVNDHPPVFTQRVYMASMPENLDINSEVVVVAATDGDEGENSVMTFCIIGGDEDRKFFIETDKVNRHGIVRLKKKIDFEKPHERTFNLTVKVEDADFFSLAYCIIQVEDSNDHAPVFFPQFYEAGSMFEDVPIGTIVTQVTAMDLDSGQNGRFTYSIAPESDPFQQFLVDKSGWVVVADSLDREKVSQHRLMILATDMGSPALTGSAIVIVIVQDVNDNGPEFEAPYRPILWENTIAPQVVHMNDTSILLHVIDRDTSSNGGPFSIRLLMLTSDVTNFNLTDLRNGSAMITALRSFDREQQKQYLLPILMIDSGSPPMSSTSTLTVIIGDKNDHPHAPGHSEFIVYNLQGMFQINVTIFRNKFRKRGVYHIPAEHESWEDIRENILNYNEEGGGEQDQSSSCTTAPLIKSSQGSQEEVHPTGATLPYHHNASCGGHCSMDFKSYVSRIIWEADNDSLAFPMDTYHVYCIEGMGSSAGSLSSLGSAVSEEAFTYDSLPRWGSKFEGLSELYRRPELAVPYMDTVQSQSQEQQQ
uniref:Cadherin domain-containing protein n=1 Tax=Sinocyclocheilus rhinocerous TaxID=307959 RepID=A0A673L7B9_9TELE